MAPIPTPLRAALGLVAAALDEARKLPDRAVELPVLAVSTALQFSLRAQQRYAELATRGDELLARLQAPPEEPPAWAKFDDEPDSSAGDTAGGSEPGSDSEARSGAEPGTVSEVGRVSEPPSGAEPANVPEPGVLDGPPSPRRRTAAAKGSAPAKAGAAKRAAAKTVRAPRRDAPSAFDAVEESASPGTSEG